MWNVLADVLAAGVLNRMTCALQSTKAVASTAHKAIPEKIDSRLSRTLLRATALLRACDKKRVLLSW